jgi:hypothetical protein
MVFPKVDDRKMTCFACFVCFGLFGVTTADGRRRTTTGFCFLCTKGGMDVYFHWLPSSLANPDRAAHGVYRRMRGAYCAKLRTGVHWYGMRRMGAKLGINSTALGI